MAHRSQLVAFALLAACASDGVEPSGANPDTLWFAMSSNREMRLVAEEPRPY